MTEQNKKPVLLDDILISPQTRDAWNRLARQTTARMARSGKRAAQIVDEQAEIHPDGSLTIFAAAGDDTTVTPQSWPPLLTSKAKAMR